eukprot:5690057-Pyramimonas_sp.AAC.1
MGCAASVPSFQHHAGLYQLARDVNLNNIRFHDENYAATNNGDIPGPVPLRQVDGPETNPSPLADEVLASEDSRVSRFERDSDAASQVCQHYHCTDCTEFLQLLIHSMRCTL